MKKCLYCGKEYPDDAIVCSSDQSSLVASEVATHPDHPKQQSIIIKLSQSKWALVVAMSVMAPLFADSIHCFVLVGQGLRPDPPLEVLMLLHPVSWIALAFWIALAVRATITFWVLWAFAPFSFRDRDLIVWLFCVALWAYLDFISDFKTA
jgi:hypothetical protein